MAEALEPDYRCPSDASPGVNSTDNGGKNVRKPEIDTGGALNENLVVEERVTLNSSKKSEQFAPEMYMLEKKDSIQEDEVLQHRNADKIEGKGDTALWGKAGVNGVPLGDWKPTVVQPALVEEQFTEEREVPQGIMNGAGEAAEGDERLGKVGLNPMGKEVARHSVGLNEDGAPEKQDFKQTVFETEKAVSEREQDWEEVKLAHKAAALNSESVQEALALREAAMPEKEKAEREVAVSETESEKPDVKGSEEETPTDLEAIGPVEEAASKKEDRSEVAILGGEKPAKENKEVMEMETPLGVSASEKTEVTQVGVSEGSTKQLCKTDVEQEEFVTEVESNREDDRKEILSEELDMARKKKKAERPKAPLREIESEREEVTRANTFKDEGTLEEEKFKEEEGETAKKVGSEEETKAPTKEKESDAEDEASSELSELTEDRGLQREDSLKERGVAMFEAVPGFEKSLENLTVLREEGGEERLVEARDTENKGRAEHLNEKVPPTEKDEGLLQDVAGELEAPQSELSEKTQAPEVTITATGEAEVCAGKDQDCLAALRGRDKEGPLPEPEGVGVMTIYQQDVPEGDSMMAEMCSQGAMAEEAEEEEKERSLGRGGMNNRNTKQDGSMREGVVVAEGDLHRGGGTAETATEKRAVLEELKTAEGKTENKASSFSDAAEEETWHNVDELLDETAAAEKVTVEEIALSREKVPEMEEVTVTSTPEAGLGALQEPSDWEGEVPQVGHDQEKGEGEATQCAGSVGEESGAAGASRLRLSPESQSELSRESLQAAQTLPMKPDFTETLEKQVQREREKADVSMNNRKA